MMKLFLFILGFSIQGSTWAQKNLVASDDGSKIHFVIKNFGIKTSGDISGLEANIKFDPNDVSVWIFDATVNASTINTDNSSRDSHLKKSEYFDVTKYPTFHILSSKIETTDKRGVMKFIGTLTIKGVTKQLQFPFKVNTYKGGYLFTGSFEINRRDFNVGESSIALADNLKVSLSVLAK
ncbi:MAG: YceI family protein [Ferruginibacter sp.]